MSASTGTPQLRPYTVGKEEGNAVWFLGALTFVKATGANTNGAFGLIEQLLPPGSASPYHVHHSEDEAFWVLEGELTFIYEGRKSRVGPGGYIFGPRGIPHGIKVEGSVPARVLVWNAPSGFEQFVIEMSEPATERILPPSAAPDMPRLMTLAAKYKIEILGPLPD